jgi:hypothetical protein
VPKLLIAVALCVEQRTAPASEYRELLHHGDCVHILEEKNGAGGHGILVSIYVHPSSSIVSLGPASCPP